MQTATKPLQTVTNVTLRARVKQNAKFLEVLADTGNITAACMVAGVHRKTIYRRKEADAEFSERWELAVEISVDKLEHVARGRAIKGAKRQLYYKGEPCGIVYEPSDRLMELLLKAHRPDKFNPVQKLEHSGGVSVSVVQFGEPSAGSQAAKQPVTINHVDEPIESTDPGSLHHDEGGALHEGGTPKLDARENDEGCHVANFADSEPE